MKIISLLLVLILSQNALASYGKSNSQGSTGYKDHLSLYITGVSSQGDLYYDNRIQSAHVLVKDIALDGLCGSYDMCFRAMVFVNGDENTGVHVATYMTSPGNPGLDSRATFTPEGLYRVRKNQQIVLAGTTYGRHRHLHVYDNYVNRHDEPMPWPVFYHKGFAFHTSNTVTGELESHGCTRLRSEEAKKINFLARHVGENFTVRITDTQNRVRLSPREQERALRNQQRMNLEAYNSLSQSQRAKNNALTGNGGLY